MVWGLVVLALTVIVLLGWASFDSLFHRSPQERLSQELARRRLVLEDLEREAVAHEARSRETVMRAHQDVLDQIHGSGLELENE